MKSHTAVQAECLQEALPAGTVAQHTELVPVPLYQILVKYIFKLKEMWYQ